MPDEKKHTMKKPTKKDAVHHRVLGHFRKLCSGEVTGGGYYKQLLNLEMYVPNTEGWLLNKNKCLEDWLERWKEDAIEIKKSSTDYYKDMDELCRKVCKRKNVKVVLLRFKKNKYENKNEKKQGSPE